MAMVWLYLSTTALLATLAGFAWRLRTLRGAPFGRCLPLCLPVGGRLSCGVGRRRPFGQARLVQVPSGMADSRGELLRPGVRPARPLADPPQPDTAGDSFRRVIGPDPHQRSPSPVLARLRFRRFRRAAARARLVARIRFHLGHVPDQPRRLCLAVRPLSPAPPPVALTLVGGDCRPVGRDDRRISGRVD